LAIGARSRQASRASGTAPAELVWGNTPAPDVAAVAQAYKLLIKDAITCYIIADFSAKKIEVGGIHG
jgi:hypothetical protein